MDFGGVENKLLLKLMSASSLRARVVADNISNQNVPGYRRQVVRFEELLAPALARGESSLDAIEPRVEADTRTPSSPDGNNVHLEVEMNAMRENRLMYELYATILQGRMDLVKSSIVEGR
jgi:flagellar basal-body rod protein FlgB